MILDGKYMKSKELVHLYIKYQLNAKEYYGNNLDALWDVLSTYSQRTEITLLNKDKLIGNMGDYGESIIKVFEDVAEENPNIIFIY